MTTSSERPVRVYADGIFDVFHFGHARALEQAKKLFPNTTLVVGCSSDKLTKKYKGKTVYNENERYESLRHCKWVDEIIRDAPWVIDSAFIEKHKIDFVAHDDLPYSDATGQSDDIYDFVKKEGKFRAIQRTEGISTTEIILRIIRDYNDFVLRNLARGYTRKDMNVSLFREKRIRATQNWKKLNQRFRDKSLSLSKNVKLLPKGLSSAQSRKKLAKKIMKNGEELAQAFEIMVGKVRGSLFDNHVFQETTTQFALNLDKYVSGFIRSFEEGYYQFESAVYRTVGEKLIPGKKDNERFFDPIES
eukprot:g1038.t1